MAASLAFSLSLENFYHKLRHYLLWELKKAKENLEHTLPPFTFLAQMVIKYPTDYTTLKKKKTYCVNKQMLFPALQAMMTWRFPYYQVRNLKFTCAITSIQSFNTSQESIFSSFTFHAQLESAHIASCDMSLPRKRGSGFPFFFFFLENMPYSSWCRWCMDTGQSFPLCYVAT